jgi:hypothetical protein
MQKEIHQTVNLRLTLEGTDAENFCRLMKKRGLTIATQLALQLFSEHYQAELVEA